MSPQPVNPGPTPADKAIESLNDLIRIQTDPGTCTDGYMRGMANGLLLARSVLDGKDPDYIDPPSPKAPPETPKGPLRDDMLMIDALFQILPADEVEVEKGAWERIREVLPPESPTPCQACKDAPGTIGGNLCEAHYVEACKEASLLSPKPVPGDTPVSLVSPAPRNIAEHTTGGWPDNLVPAPQPIQPEAGT